MTFALTESQYVDKLLELPLDANLQFGVLGSSTVATPWDSLTSIGTAYTTGQMVAYQGGVYQAAGSTTGNLPTDGTHWTFLALTNIGATWAKRQPKVRIGGFDLQYEYSRYDLVNEQLGRIARVAVMRTREGSVNNDEPWAKNLQDIRNDAMSQIGVIEKRAAANRGCVVGQMVNVTPQTALNPFRDPNNPILNGDPRYCAGVPWWSF